MSDAARLLPSDPTPPPAPPSGGRDVGTVRVAGWLAAALAIFGLLCAAALAVSREARPHSSNIFYRLYFRTEPWHLGLLLLFGLAVALRRPHAPTVDPAPGEPRLPTAALAALVGVVALALWPLALHATTFSMDEFAAVFQARLLATGRVFGEIPALWRPFARDIEPLFVSITEDGSHWVATYTPGYALLRAPFEALGAGWLLNPLLGAAAVLLVAHLARVLWPGADERRWSWTAAALLAVSPQLLLTSASAYAMPAHLALNLAWLALYLRRTPRATVALGPVGALALALHNPFPHALFVAPFLLRLLRERRWGTLAYLGTVYAATSVAILGWLRMIGRHDAAAAAAQAAERAAAGLPAVVAGGGGLASAFAIPAPFHLFTLALSWVLLLTWHTPACVVGWVAAARRPLALPTVLRDAALGVGLTLCFYAFYPFDQGNGWGYRYAYGQIGSLVLLATFGLRAAADGYGQRATARLVAVSLVLTAALQLPLRALQVEATVRPMVRALAYVQALPAGAVTVPVDSLWYGVDLLRNDPLLRARPVVMHERPPAVRDSLAARIGAPVRVVTPDELTALGMERVVTLGNGGRFW
jgi:hypothetical protein